MDLGAYKDVITQLQVESLLNVNGLTGGKLLKPSNKEIPKTVIFIQCAGSRYINNAVWFR